MTTDKSYTVIKNAFDNFILAIYPPSIPTPLRNALEAGFFAGAAAACGAVINTPDLIDTIKEEISDRADQIEALQTPLPFRN